MVVIGLTGGIASGKSTVSKILEKLGAPVFDADKEAHALLEKGSIVCSEIKEEFINKYGYDILKKDGTIDRAKLGEVVFSNKALLEYLEQTMHHHIKERMLKFIDEYKEKGYCAVVVDVPLLIEVEWYKDVDKVWVVHVPESDQIERLMVREIYDDEKYALKRIRAQMPLAEKLKYADVVIDNTGTVEETEKTVRKLWKDLACVENM